jgi:glycine cleavage system aminomethyltransferase T
VYLETSSGWSPRLETLVQRAGGVVAMRGGRRVVIGYGSAAGELAACVSEVGLADCSHLAAIRVEGPGEQLTALVQRMTAARLAVGGVVRCGGAWWCRVTPDEVMAVGAPAGADRLLAMIRGAAARRTTATIRDVSPGWACLAVAGRRADSVLAAAGAFGEARDPRRVAPARRARVAGVDGLWLLCCDKLGLVLVPRAQAGVVWTALLRAGRTSGICCIGVDALARYALGLDVAL